ncbi:hypothetical protein LJN75_002771 [Citrobacter freundii]|nr:hypothetical protein [Citrobacter freundii]
MIVPPVKGGLSEPPYLLQSKEQLMSGAPTDKNFDIAAFILTGNLMIKLVEKGVIDMRDANDIIARTRTAYSLRECYKDERTGSDAGEFIETLFNKLWDSRPFPPTTQRHDSE